MFSKPIAFWKEGTAAVKKGIAKWFVGGVLLAAISMPFYIFSGGIPEGLLSNGEFDVKLIPSWLSSILNPTELIESLIPLVSYYSNYLIAHPFRAVIGLVGFVLLVISIYLGLKFRRTIVMHLKENARRKRLLEKVGLTEYWATADPVIRVDQWLEMAERISASPQTIINYIGATGWDTFGSESSPLHNSLTEFGGSIKVILMNPESKFLPERAHSVDMEEDDYKSQIKKSTKILKELKGKGHAVELKYYDSPPNWKMIFTPLTLWLQHYHNDDHVADLPVYLFYETNEMKGLYQAYAKDFKRIWSLCNDVDLN